MKRRIILAVLSVFLSITIMATPALAKDPDKGEGAQGVPFQELWDAVADLQERISDIQSMVEEAVDDAMSSLVVDWSQITNVPSGLDDGDDVGITEEGDPVFGASAAAGITGGDIANWRTAYGWGNHADAGYLKSYTEIDPVFGESVAASITAADIAKWNAGSGGGTGDGHSLDAADGDPQDAVYVDNEGNVGVGTTSPSGIFEARGTIALTLDLNVAPQVTHPKLGGQIAWQSFTPKLTGKLAKVQVKLRRSPDCALDAKLSILNAAGGVPFGTPLVTQEAYVTKYLPGESAAAWITWELYPAPPVVAGHQYAWQLSLCKAGTSVPRNVWLLASESDVYGGGRANADPALDYLFRTYVAPYKSLVFTENGNLGIGTADPGNDTLDVRGRAYASGGWQTTNADYAEWFEKEEEAVPGDIIGINLETGKARKYRPGDWFIGVCSTKPAYVGNRLSETDEEMAKTHILVGLLGQIDINEEQVIIEGRIVKTTDSIEIGILLNNGKVLIGR